MLVTLGWLLVVGPLHPASAITDADSHSAGRQHSAGRISVWPDREQPYRRGEGVRIYLRTEKPGHVTVLRVDTEGRVRVLFPREPWERNHVLGGRTLEVADSRERPSFTIDDGPGIGYLFAVISATPFEYGDVTRGDYWDFRLIEEGRIRGDPYVALAALARRIAPGGNFRYDIAPYYVGRRYDFPRFLCYDCHSYASYDEWDPYTTPCSRYRVVIYDDPAYYPFRYSEGRSVVSRRPVRQPPRYVFRDVKPGVEYVTRLRQHETQERSRSPGDRGRTSADVGGRSAIPAPGVIAGDSMRPGRSAQGRDPAASARERPPRYHRQLQERRRKAREGDPPDGLRPVDREPRNVPAVQRGARDPQSTGEPELRRRKP